MNGRITTSNEEIYIGLKCDPSKCPKCGTALIGAALDINLTESRCGSPECGYSTRDRVGSIKDAEEVRGSHPPLRIMR